MGTTTPPIQRLIGRAASAYTAGPVVENARAACQHAARKHLATILCYWNRSEDSPSFVAQSYIGLLQLIADLRSDSYLSIKAPAVGFDTELLETVVENARRRGNTPVHFDAMSPETVDRTFRMMDQVQRSYSNIGCTLPGRWRRSVSDVDSAVHLGLRVRVVKGEWCGLGADETDRYEGYMQVVERLAARRARHVAIATHDTSLASRCIDCLKAAGVSCELELLYGLPIRGILELAQKKNVRARMYVPYGPAGLPYRLKDIFRNPRIFMWFARDLIRASPAA
jgi:proline dehydrogenase